MNDNTNSTTPRTDAEQSKWQLMTGSPSVSVAFARTLETELQQAQREVERLGNDLFEKQSVITELAGRAFTTAQECGLLKQEVVESKRDKERLDWAIRHHASFGDLVWGKGPFSDANIMFAVIRQAIDNAMKEK